MERVDDSSKDRTKEHESQQPSTGPVDTLPSSDVNTSASEQVDGALRISINRHNSYRGSDSATASDQYESLLTRATHTIQAALRMDAVSFVDAPFSTTPVAEDRTPARSQSNTLYAMPNGEICISQNLHNELLSLFPRGSYFNFMNKRAEDFPKFAALEVECDLYCSHDEASELRETVQESKLDASLRSAFPKAKSLIFLPLFGSENGDCRFSIVAWSSEERRVLQQEDFAYLGLFGVAVQAEFSRIISAIQNRAKSDFISSISHELRSPLHGILGNTELLLDSEIEHEQRQMAEMIEKCGRSLLSTMDHM